MDVVLHHWKVGMTAARLDRMAMFFSSKQLVGLDIGASSLKVAQVKVTGRGPVLTHFAMIPLPPSCVAGGEILDPNGVSQTIRSLFEEAKIKSKNVATGMWGSSVIVKKNQHSPGG